MRSSVHLTGRVNARDLAAARRTRDRRQAGSRPSTRRTSPRRPPRARPGPIRPPGDRAERARSHVRPDSRFVDPVDGPRDRRLPAVAVLLATVHVLPGTPGRSPQGSRFLRATFNLLGAFTRAGGEEPRWNAALTPFLPSSPSIVWNCRGHGAGPGRPALRRPRHAAACARWGREPEAGHSVSSRSLVFVHRRRRPASRSRCRDCRSAWAPCAHAPTAASRYASLGAHDQLPGAGGGAGGRPARLVHTGSRRRAPAISRRRSPARRARAWRPSATLSSSLACADRGAPVGSITARRADGLRPRALW